MKQFHCDHKLSADITIQSECSKLAWNKCMFSNSMPIYTHTREKCGIIILTIVNLAYDCLHHALRPPSRILGLSGSTSAIVQMRKLNTN